MKLLLKSALFSFLLIHLANATCASSGQLNVCLVGNSSPGGDMYSLATNDTSDPKSFFSLTGYQSNMPIEMYNSTWNYSGQCNTGRSSFSGLDVVNNTFYTWYGWVPSSFPNNNPYLGSSVYMFNRDCTIKNAIHLDNQNGRTAFSHNRTHLFTVSGGVEIFDFSEILNPSRPPLVPPKIICSAGGSDIHAHPDGSFWTVNSGSMEYYHPNCTLASSFSMDAFGITGGLRGIVSDDRNSKVWVSQAGGMVYEFSVGRNDIVSLQNYPSGSNVTMYGNQANQIKLLVSPRGNYTIYPTYPNGTRIHYNSAYGNIQIIWNSHSEAGYDVKESAFNGNRSFAYFTIIHKGNDYNQTSVRFVVEQDGSVVGNQNFTFNFIQITENQTARYYQRFNPEDHAFGAVNMTPPDISFDYRNSTLEVFFSGSPLVNVTGDVDDLADEEVAGPHENPEYKQVFYYNNSGEEYWVLRLWFGWFADGSDIPLDQFPDMETFDIWINKSALIPVYIQTFPHFSSMWFRPNISKNVIIGDADHFFNPPEEDNLFSPRLESHTPSPNEHDGFFYFRWIPNPFLTPLRLNDPSNAEFDILHTSGSQNMFGMFEKPRESINTYIRVIPSSNGSEPTVLEVNPGTEVDVEVTTANDGSVHDTLAGKIPEVSLTVVRTFFIPMYSSVVPTVPLAASVGFEFSPVSSSPFPQTDAPAGHGSKTVFKLNTSDGKLPMVDISTTSWVESIFARTISGNLTDIDYAILVPTVAKSDFWVWNMAGSINMLQRRLHAFAIEKNAMLAVNLAWPGSDLDINLTDPLGRSAWFNRTSGELISEIPGLNYSGPYSNPETVTIANATAGNWTVEVIAIELNNSEPYVVSAIIMNATEEPPPETPQQPALSPATPTSNSAGGGPAAPHSFKPATPTSTSTTQPPATEEGENEMTPRKENITKIGENRQPEPTGLAISNSIGPMAIGIALAILLTIFLAFRRFL